MQAQREIADDFALFGDWMDRYQYLIDLGRRLPPLESHERVDDNLIRGCQSQVWFVASRDGDRLTFRAASDAAIVSGLIALLLNIYSDRTAADILASSPDFIADLELEKHLSPTRSNGLVAMLNAIRSHAEAAA